MLRSLTVASLATLALGGFTGTPSHADSDDVVKVLAGAAALAVIGHAMSQGHENGSEQNATTAGVEAVTPMSDRCKEPTWNTREWVDQDGQPCDVDEHGTSIASASTAPITKAPTAQVSDQPLYASAQRCLRSRWDGALTIRYFDRDCMIDQGHQLGLQN